ncbi:MAG: hypothetical protein GXZ06_06685 [Tissierellia bacterium]|nr:hypothetical protein [Tissierellia bacterium]
MRKIILIYALVLISTVLISCSHQISYDSFEELIKHLKSKGYDIVVEDVEKSILAGKRKWITINDSENISVYLYNKNEQMEKDASYLSADGSSYDNGRKVVMIEWFSYPYFFKKENMIVLYVGDNLEIVHILEEFLGPQFAGYGE